MYISLLEDDKTLADQVLALLESHGHTTSHYMNGTEMIRNIQRYTVDLYVLDWQVPGATGIEVLHHIRNVQKLTTPVLFLTSRNDEQDVIAVFNAGADDYCVKPVRANEFMARLSALLRRSYPPSKQGLVRTYNGYVFNTIDQTISFDGTTQSLSEKEFKLALFLFENQERALSRERLMIEVWSNDGDTLSRSLDVHISWLRKKLQLSASSKYFHLKAIHGIGYRLVKTGKEAAQQTEDVAMTA
jgi:DNA-binding response OmpR family regulator